MFRNFVSKWFLEGRDRFARAYQVSCEQGRTGHAASFSDCHLGATYVRVCYLDDWGENAAPLRERFFAACEDLGTFEAPLGRA